MKVVCESCQAKYTVADEKVQGKTAKIKCKRCGATIVVSSAGVVSTTGGSSEASAINAAPAGTSYMVNVGEGDQRTMSVAEIVDAYNASTIDGETFVWADGLPDWQPLSAVAEIVAALNAGAASADVAAAADPEPSLGEAQPRAAVRRDPARSADLFGARPEPVAAPAPEPDPGFFPGNASKLAGQRDENSMLFSLSALTAKVPTGASGQTTATKEDSGLIDLKALGASSAGVHSDLLPDSMALLPLGAPPPPPSPVPVVAPVGSIAPPPAKSKTPLFIGIGAVVAVLAVVGAFFATREEPPPPAPVVVATAPTAEPTAAPTAEPTAEPVADATPSAAPSASAPVATNRPAGTKPSGGAKPAGGSSGDSGSKPAGAATPASTKPAAPARGNCGCAPSDLMCAMRCSAGKK